VLDSTVVIPCQLPWIHPIESIPPAHVTAMCTRNSAGKAAESQ
jgi:hypothetical protein